MAAQDRKGPKKYPHNIYPNQSKSEISKLIQAVFDMKVKMGCMRKALSNAGITIERSPNVQKPREKPAHGRQKKERSRRIRQTRLSKSHLYRSTNS